MLGVHGPITNFSRPFEQLIGISTYIYALQKSLGIFWFAFVGCWLEHIDIWTKCEPDEEQHRTCKTCSIYQKRIFNIYMNEKF